MLELSDRIWEGTLSQFRRCGCGERECVGYWVSSNDDFRIVEVVHPEHTATPWSYDVNPNWLTNFGIRLARRQQSVRAQVHTHGGRAGHSPTDDAWPMVHQPGFLSVVVPDFAVRSPAYAEIFAAEIAADGRWSVVEAHTRIQGLR